MLLLMTRRFEVSYEQLQSKRKLCTKSRKKCRKESLEGGKKAVLRQRAVTVDRVMTMVRFPFLQDLSTSQS